MGSLHEPMSAVGRGRGPLIAESWGSPIAAPRKREQMRLLEQVQFLAHLRMENVIFIRASAACFVDLRSPLVR